jgi:hypothetical protein
LSLKLNYKKLNLELNQNLKAHKLNSKNSKLIECLIYCKLKNKSSNIKNNTFSNPKLNVNNNGNLNLIMFHKNIS